MPGDKGRIYRFAVLAIATGMLTFSPLQEVRAEGLIQSFFTSLGHVLHAPARLPERIPALAAPLQNLERTINPPQERADLGPARAFCVRTCDGHYFPVQARAGMSAAEACQSFCPASQTKLYAGSNIDYAVARDGSRYADLANAYAYRRQLVVGCTCNGRDQFGLAHVDAATDPTLRPGDVVATQAGMVVFTGRKNGSAEFTAAASYPHFSKTQRDQLAAMRIAPATATNAPSDLQASFPPPSAWGLNLRSAQR